MSRLVAVVALAGCGSAATVASSTTGSPASSSLVQVATLAPPVHSRLPACRFLDGAAVTALGLASSVKTVIEEDHPDRCVVAIAGDRSHSVTLVVTDPQTDTQFVSEHPGVEPIDVLGLTVYAVDVGGQAALVTLLPQGTMTITGFANLERGEAAIAQMLGRDLVDVTREGSCAY